MSCIKIDRRVLVAFAVLVVCLSLGMHTANGATIVIVNTDGPGEGFNDPTAAPPVGGNPGVTIGQQRLNCFIEAATYWEACLFSNVTITIDAAMDPLFCTPTQAVLGSAGPNTIHRNFSGAPVGNTWYVQALANSLNGSDLTGTTDGGMQFNSNLNGSGSCLGGTEWYYGFDASPPGGDIDFVSVLIHEMGHVLGFLTILNADGTLYGGLGSHDSYGRLMYHNGASPPDYPSMTNAQRAAGNIGDPNLVFDGTNVNTLGASILIAGMVGGRVRLHGPNPYQGGSSLSHFSTALSPNQLMEPSYTGPNHNIDLEAQLMKDTGWVLIPKDPICQVAPTSLDFDTLEVGNNSDMNFTITNIGAGTLNGNVSEACADFSIISGGGAYSLAASESVVVTVRFEPGSSGAKNCTIETGTALCSDVSANGTAEDPPMCVVTPTTIDFDTTAVGDSSDQNFIITNTGGQTVSGTVTESCADYSLLVGGGPYSLASGETLQVTVRFEPTVVGSLFCTIDTGDSLCPDVNVTGVGIIVVGVNPRVSYGFELDQNHPNPFNPQTHIGYSVDANSRVVLAIYDVSGVLVRRLVDRHLPAGRYSERWDGTDRNGNTVPSGVYFYRLSSGSKTLTRKAVLLK